MGECAKMDWDFSYFRAWSFFYKGKIKEEEDDDDDDVTYFDKATLSLHPLLSEVMVWLALGSKELQRLFSCWVVPHHFIYVKLYKFSFSLIFNWFNEIKI